MKIDILICTLNEGIRGVPSVLLSPMDGVRYVVCMQYNNEEALDSVPMKMMVRKDAKLYVHESIGLSKNRNFALDWAEADVCVVADDDNRYKEEYIDTIRKAYEEHPEADIICFESESYEGVPAKKYPQSVMPYQEARKHGYYPSSVEMTFRTSSIKSNGIRFNENFGLGSPLLCAGEEDVFLKDAEDKGLNILFIPKVIVQTTADNTGLHFLENKKLQITKGATFQYLYGTPNTIWRSIKESIWWMLHKGANPFGIFMNMMKGMKICCKRTDLLI